VSVRRCENCKWWDLVGGMDDGKSFGLCHYNPPQVRHDDELPPWPFTDNTDWCSQMTARENA
jgi:hypothetical protein